MTATWQDGPRRCTLMNEQREPIGQVTISVDRFYAWSRRDGLVPLGTFHSLGEAKTVVEETLQCEHSCSG